MPNPQVGEQVLPRAESRHHRIHEHGSGEPISEIAGGGEGDHAADIDARLAWEGAANRRASKFISYAEMRGTKAWLAGNVCDALELPSTNHLGRLSKVEVAALTRYCK